METKHQVHNLIILDESGSMSSIKEIIISGFNQLVKTIQGIETEFPEQEHFITFITFNGSGIKMLHYMDPAKSLKNIDYKSYNPSFSTPLFDAMGYALNKLKQTLEGKTDYNVLVTILTDGEENDSKEFTGKQIKKLVEELKQHHWTFTYIGTDHDIEKIASSLSIDNTLYFEKNSAGLKDMFSKEKSARELYCCKLASDKDLDSDFDYYNSSKKNKKK